ncbi:MAG: Membrane proteins related to metalloendopeptidases [uncultured Nocardioides sp.]|uniref:Membrane proteins related to metalloendopeptidases n=1 Tax=uncultured Nocardioides sp. TaxID=198441 RepID=A0A6J4NEJ0_9ACTN|nr:MAG: Membrane proteins related to metalloendopeptidases [uncultured Nocardioides sp.]
MPAAHAGEVRYLDVLAPLVLVLTAPGRSPEPVRAGVEGHWPLDPRPEVVRAFDPPADPWGAGHRGVDLAGHAGQVVRTALPGTVAFAGSIAGKPVVTVVHGARRTTYEPVVATVAVGDPVSGGQPIGRLSVLHGHCLPAACLHWGLRRGDTYLDPLTLVGGGPVRLLPLWRDVPATTTFRPWKAPLASWAAPLELHLRPLDALP